MPSGLIALLDDVAMIAKLASASVDDIAGATAKAGAKAAGVVIDDTAVTLERTLAHLVKRRDEALNLRDEALFAELLALDGEMGA